MAFFYYFFFFFQAEDGIRDAQESRGLGDVYKRQVSTQSTGENEGTMVRGPPPGWLAPESAAEDAPKPTPKLGKSGKRICCSCPETRKARDECIIVNGEEACSAFIKAHKACLRAEGFDV
eukprot:TRINITY_DN29004_c0_g1_i2.p1 TRINITY_DN29004_c0_g1~~TRINITY_DN29004_c0_g1_i2.p1  ORF type:complete len:120 (+),score=41.67 TRINITY_DN29004_c0_g1_i2:110-469(+)